MADTQHGRGSTRRFGGRRRAVGVAVGIGLVILAGCGGDGDATGGTATTISAPAASGATAEASGGDGTDGGTTAPDVTPAAGSAAVDATWDAGDVQMRVVNLLADPVDVYVRTSGFVEAYEAFLGVAPGEVTALVAPPADGALVITVAGAGDAECVGSCPHFLAELTASEPEGPVRTVIMHEWDGTPAAFDLWESPTSERLGNSNSMPPADATQGLVVVSAVDVLGADFGLRLGFAGASGCAGPVNDTNVLVGGNQTPAFGYVTPTVAVSLYDSNDRECAGPAVGGPFTVAGGPGTRTHLVLTGSPGAMDAIVLPMVGDEAAAAAALADASTSADGDGTEASGPERDLAIELMAAEVETGLGVLADQSTCVAGLLVDAIGVDVLLVDGALIDLDTLPDTYEAPATDALVASVDACGVDPSLFGVG